MSHVINLRVTASILAVSPIPTSPDIVTIPAGSVIETHDDITVPGLHHVTLDGKSLLAFTRDIQERTEHLGTP
jgi:hypothetical protein